MTGKEFWDDLIARMNVGPGDVLMKGAAQTGAAAGAAAGTQGSVGEKVRAAAGQIVKPPPVPPGEAVKQTALSAVGLGPIAGDLRGLWVWAIIAVVGLIGVWGLVAPGGGVAVVQRLRK